jgi:hypothetical protein
MERYLLLFVFLLQVGIFHTILVKEDTTHTYSINDCLITGTSCIADRQIQCNDYAIKSEDLSNYMQITLQFFYFLIHNWDN